MRKQPKRLGIILGIAVFSATGTDLMPGACLMFRKGQAIELPSSAGLPNGASVRCWVYPIGAE